MKTDTKTNKLKPRRMWANAYPNTDILHRSRSMATACAWNATHEAVPVAVIPLDDVPALIQKVSLGIDDMVLLGSLDAIARAALAAIGVLPRAKKGGRK